ncbi:Putative collagen-binding domain of a collagenase [Lutibacter oricola]|uniref:Putative collagen-binding domain of a collagenase n=1 Tax=Lutibacter oricola TaxID=762486 RepID=A0A1H3D6G7_9FLAO|nr:DUF5060 domain-containing protein [Lutibacter oricola]SDX61975.1 Putative collagen-binding domain of a collagenase [Lutibacter oricola]
MKKLYIITSIIFYSTLAVYAQNSKVEFNGELKKWHKITLSFTGEELSENDANNPFLNYRLNVTFKNKNKTYIIPGFYAADGNSAETSATNGKIWQVRFTPDEIGEWTYNVSFRKGNQIAINDNPNAGEPISFNGLNGKFNIEKSDKTGRDFRSKGRLNYVNKRYLQFEETKEYFLKGGADSPESFLGYYDFDQTPPSHKYEAHAKDWKNGDPTWQNGKGKNMIGALNYLASKGMNSVYFLTMSVQGDGNDVWPWNNINERYRFDCSKLDQWEIVFDHMEKLGLMMHIVTQETENELLLDIGELGVQRKLYYRELIARFSHHLAITWNLGEENGPLSWTPKGQDDKDRKAMAKYIKTHDPYKNFVALHTHADPKAQDPFLNPLLGYEYLDGPSMQTHHPKDVHRLIVKWINESQKAGKQWVVCQDEIGPADTGAKPDADDPEHNEIRHEVLWGNLMAGGAGVEWYFGYKYAHNDLKCEDWRSRDILWDQTKHALDFFQNHVPFQHMKSANGLTDNSNDYVLAENGKTYVIYLPKVEKTILNLIGANSKFNIKWYNPRVGGELQKGSVKTIKGGKKVSIGFPPNKEKDWVALITNTSKKAVVSNSKNKQEKIILNALSDFEIDPTSEATYYVDNRNKALAINAGKKTLRDKFANATTIFKGANGIYKGMLVSMAENDGESVYRVKINGNIVSTFTNPETDKSFEETQHNIGKIYLETNDIIEVEAKAVTNKKIPENDETAWSRGRWNSIILIPGGGYQISNKHEKTTPFTDKKGVFTIEAEDFHFKTSNGTNRDWYTRSNSESLPFKNLENHKKTASKNSYIEALPDTRVTHDDELITGENFYPLPGFGAIVSYKVKIKSPGKYYVWVKAYSSGPEDNGLHVGINETWPETGARIQLCEGKNKWTWTSAQRVPENHCGTPNTISLNFDKKGDYIISFSMREDGFEFDKWILTKKKNFNPNNI